MKIVHVNTAAENLFRSSKENLQNTKLSELFANDKSIIINQVYDAIALNQSSTSRDIEISLKTKTKHNVDCNVQTIFLEKDKHVLLEIRTLKRIKNIVLNANFINQNNATEMITRSIAHEIKNPLGGIKGAAQLLKKEINEEQKEYTDIIIEEADRLKNYIDKMHGPKDLPSFKSTNIHLIIDKVLKILGIKSSNYKKNYDPSIPLLYLDQDMIIQSLLNIIKNASEAITENGLIEIKTRVDRSFTINSIRHKLVAIISIIDDGVGVNKEIASKLFLPLITNKKKGNGLGLSISQRLISINKGIITFEEENSKTTFKIILPIEKY
jgi:two-component system nitrogen regulation sensor histidine kinase GlnL